jgi:cysteinyl-tRNA synthetase
LHRGYGLADQWRFRPESARAHSPGWLYWRIVSEGVPIPGARTAGAIGTFSGVHGVTHRALDGRLARPFQTLPEPRLSPFSMTLRIHNTLSRRLEAFEPLEPGHVRMYVCGMTIYDLCHIGHARMMMAFDVVQRWLKVSGYRVTYVRNITDIDDKIIRRAVERGITLRALTDEMTAAMHQDIAVLGIEPPSVEPRATQYVPQMLSLIARLQEKGLAYQADNGDVNFAVRQFAGYGKLSGKSLDDLRAGERVAVAGDKNDPLDFVLWKSAKPDEPAEARWDSPFGAGRPGWHIECSAMSCATLGETFDIHGGGADLQFPHHENEIAQSEGATGQPLARFWMHNGFVRVDNEKMSKSLGNFFTIREVLEKFDAETVRFFILRAHYRSPLNYSDVHLDDARGALKRLYTALASVDPAPVDAIDWSEPHARRFREAMDEDFGTPDAVAVLFDLASEVNRSKSAALAGQLRALGGTLGLLQANPQTYLQGGGASGLDESQIQALIAERAAAKQAKNFAEADRIRQSLLAKGVVLKDSATGTTWERA